ncbi:MAG: UDP-N-acetylglucosamine 2-epimerase (non-hydrolyzing) [Lachnospiraceae bacterium]|nr:UDP-N-acetylglucosamine 2-epimerase (non-hydrolyzing) [Lachnospiraceae bacterium]
MSHLIMHVVGNRPQFIKLAPISKEIRKREYEEVIIHTGQHFDENMSKVFFRELDIPKPNENLHISGGSHAEMTARIMIALEPVVIKYNPCIVIVYGDTNSTLAAALVVRKLNIPIVHIEAGIRTELSENPEEANRILVDHASEVLCTPDRKSYKNLEKEGLKAKSYFTGDVMYDSFCYYKDKINIELVLQKYGIKRKEYILMTWHRQENTTDAERMSQILDFIEYIKRPIICPMHPRTYNKLKEKHLLDKAMNIAGFRIIQPVGYLETIALSSNSRMILTDSGGLSKESYFANAKCLFMMDLNIWPDLEEIGWIVKMSQNNEKNIRIIEQCFNSYEEDEQHKEMFYGDGHAAEKIIDLIENMF